MKIIVSDSRLALVLCTASLLILGACAEEGVAPPAVKKIPKELEIHGDVRVDDYYWLNERENPEVISYLEVENEYTDTVMATPPACVTGFSKR